jgi:hypothetical protein
MLRPVDQTPLGVPTWDRPRNKQLESVFAQEERLLLPEQPFAPLHVDLE